MSKRKIEDIAYDIVFPIVQKNLFELVDVEYVKEGSDWHLRVYIDKPGGIKIDDCQMVSLEFEKELDRLDPIKESYILEVSSPGLERPLKKESDFVKHKGQLVELKLFEPIDAKKIYEGVLVGLIDNKIIITSDNKKLEFERSKVAQVKRVLKF